MSPDCAQGKCSACVDEAWDESLDRVAACGCSCHVDAVLGAP